ncbi:MAG: phosphopentomutase [Clostridia bacterium]|nr:phosphopentomutase [Clostridia bacterium]
MKRVFLVVLDSFGIGELPDAASFGDRGANTLASVATSPKLCVPHMRQIGLGNIAGVTCLPAAEAPIGAYGRAAEKSAGKDTTIGHWEIAGIYSGQPLPTYPNGFPDEVIDAFSAATGRGVLCNLPYSGTDVIRDYGEQHVKTGDLIVYTSADSVFQIAAHEDVIPVAQLYEYCRIARRILTGRHAVGRVIARPFVGQGGQYTRTGNRRDFSVEPPQKTLLNAVCETGQACIAVGKIADIFAGSGITEEIHTHNNSEGTAVFLDLLSRDFTGLCFVNLVDFDSQYGHRRDVDGYAAALSAFDAALPAVLSSLREEDLLIITADHGCDPGYTKTTDHTREYTPILVCGKQVLATDLGTRATFADIGATVAEWLGLSFRGTGSSFLQQIKKSPHGGD